MAKSNLFTFGPYSEDYGPYHGVSFSCFGCLELTHDGVFQTARNILLDLVNEKTEIGRQEFRSKATSAQITISGSYYQYDQHKEFELNGNFKNTSGSLLGITGKIKSISAEYRAEDNRLGLAIRKLKDLRFEDFFQNDWDYAEEWASEINNKGLLKGFKDRENTMYIDDLHNNLDKWLRPKFLGGSEDDLMRAKYYVGTSSLKINGKGGNDTISGGKQGDTLVGLSGNDSISGEGGDDYLSGGKGDDILDGGLSDDIIHGGHGNDVMAGGQGSDVFQLSPGIDRVSDFDLDDDKVALGKTGKYIILDDPEGVLVGESSNHCLLLLGTDYDQVITVGDDLFH